jgi:hypothetical protein
MPTVTMVLLNTAFEDGAEILQLSRCYPADSAAVLDAPMAYRGDLRLDIAVRKSVVSL